MDTLLKRWQKRRSLCRHASMILTSLDKLANTKGKELTTHEDLNTLYLLLTYRCNLKCVICDTWKLQVVTEKELALSEIKNLFNSSEYLRNIKFLVLGGAEPMLRKDFAPIVTFFIKNYTHISLGTTSNGYDTRLVTSRLQEISKACSIENFYIGFSLDGIGNLHDKIRGTGGAFESLVNTVTQLRNAYPDVKLWLTFTITPINYMQIMDAFEFSKKYKMEFSAQFLIPEQGKLKLRFNGKQLDKIDEMITKIIEDKYRMDPTAFSSLYHFSKLVPYQKSKKRVIKNCGAGSLYTFINPYGEIVFCPKQENYLQNHTHQKFIIGNIKDASFDKIWLSPKAFEMRKWIAEDHCSCWLLCSSMPVLGRVFESVPL